ncbi:sugar transferase [Sulfurimonas sp. HSL1-6]|uniref:sugar transferase n=1 Tax=Thiomicrolovo immobilis TaxID=3131935 RepID=UPI0031F9B0A8
MREDSARLVLMLFDAAGVYVSIVLAYVFVWWLEEDSNAVPGDINHYTDKLIVYILVILTFITLKLYRYRRDFWDETRLILKGLGLSFFMVLSVLALNKSVADYSDGIIILSYVFMGFVLPSTKFVLKRYWNVFGLWPKKASVISGNSKIGDIIFGNRYLGYVKTSPAHSDVVFMDTSGNAKDHIEARLSKLVRQKKKIIFIPLLNSFDYTRAGIVNVFNARTNMIVLENALQKRSNIILKNSSDVVMSILLLPLLVPVFALIAFLIKREEPKGSVFFKQERLGKNGRTFVCYKFRSMREDGDKVLEQYLQTHPEEVENYQVYHKYENDPRITKIGAFLRRTSLDELPQIINVLRSEMSLIGPRPYMLNEKAKIGADIDLVLAVKPGISGLWQVSGRSDVDFHSRVAMDVYYTRNWRLWMDFVIFFKTIKTVLVREGAS